MQFLKINIRYIWIGTQSYCKVGWKYTFYISLLKRVKWFWEKAKMWTVDRSRNSKDKYASMIYSKRNVLITNHQMYHNFGIQNQNKTVVFLFVEYWVLIFSDGVKFWSMISQSFFIYLFSKINFPSDAKQAVRGRSLPDWL